MIAQWILGRAEGCDIRITDEYASLHHARIIRDDLGRHWVEDLGSTNGTRVLHNGATVKVTARHLLFPGDVIVIGRTGVPWPGEERAPIRATAEVGNRSEVTE